MVPYRFRRPAFLVAAALALLSSSCVKSENHKPVVPVKGQVLVDGKPAAGALVIFHPMNDTDPKAVRPSAYVDEQGYFALTSYTNQDGAPEGDYAVTVVWPMPNPEADDGAPGTDRLQGRYNSFRSTGLRARIGTGPTELPPFLLIP